MKDTHIHSGLIEHTNDDIKTIVETAKRLGFTEITILEHFSPFKIKFPSNSDPSNTIFIDKVPKEYPRRTSNIQTLIDQCNASGNIIKINKSLEVDFHIDYLDVIKGLKKFNLDYLTLGCHYSIDPEAESSEKLVHVGFKEKRDEFVAKYGKDVLLKSHFENMLAGVKSGLFKVVAHIDSIAGFFETNAFELIKPILAEMVKRKMVLEVGFRNGRKVPSKEIIDEYKRLGGSQFTFGSDSHSVKDLINSVKCNDFP